VFKVLDEEFESFDQPVVGEAINSGLPILFRRQRLWIQFYSAFIYDAEPFAKH
jgi:hypothetical protein